MRKLPLLRVGFNAALLSPTSDYRAAGMHRYIAALLDALASLEDLAVTAFVPAAGPDLHAAYGLPRSIAIERAPAWVRRPWGRILWEQTALGRQARRAGCQILHAPAHAMPALGAGPAVVTVHDLSFFRIPEAFPPAKARYLQRAMRHAAEHAAALIAVSDFTKRELIDIFGLAPERIHVVANGVDARFRPLPAGAVESWRQEAGLPADYILTVGTLQPRKNLSTLLEAYARLRSERADAPELVIAGAPGWGESDLGPRADQLGITDHVRFPGYVPAERLPELYNAASLLAFPSWYEGFGLPVLEAMACGTPCLVSDAASLPEVAGPEAPRVAPGDVAGWARTLGELLDDPNRRQALATTGLRRAAGSSWTRAAEATAEVYRQVATGGALAIGRDDIGRDGVLGPEALQGSPRDDAWRSQPISERSAEVADASA